MAAALNGARAPDVPGFGVRGDWSLASFNITNVFHFSGGYELPFGKDKHYLSQREQAREWARRRVDASTGSLPFRAVSLSPSVARPPRPPAPGCYDVTVPGQSPKLGIKVKPNASGHLTPYWFGNPQPSNSLASWATTDATGTEFTSRMRTFDWFRCSGQPSGNDYRAGVP